MHSQEAEASIQRATALRRKYNALTRPAGVTHKKWTEPRWLVPLSADSLRDPLWRLNWLYHIVTADGQRIVFQMKPGMFKYYLEQHYRNVILKARQYGFTTAGIIEQLDDCLFNPNRRAQMTAHNLEAAKEIFHDKAKYAYITLNEFDPSDETPPDTSWEQMAALGQGVQEAVPIVRETKEELTFRNNSRLKITTSGRSGTIQRLHVSEYGKLAAAYPEKAREVRTGSLPAAEKAILGGTGMATVESTAEGQSGHFKELCDEAMLAFNETHRKDQVTGELRRIRPLRRDEWKLHFHAWHEDDDYVSDPNGVIINARLTEYFDVLRSKHNILLSAEQKAWYVQTERAMKGDMRREFPSTPEEAFMASAEGAYFAQEMRDVRLSGRIRKFDIVRSLGVQTLWDLGFDDSTAIWFWQKYGPENRLVGYYENSGEGILHYKNYLDSWREEHGITYSHHWGPHDLEVHDLMTGISRLQTAAELGLSFNVVPKSQHKPDDIEGLRRWLGTCIFHEEYTFDGYSRLEKYRKEWDEKHGKWKDRPHHDENSHAADSAMLGPKAEALQGFMTPHARPVRVVSSKGWTG